MYFCQRLINGTRLAVLIILGQVDIVDKVFYGQRAFFSFAFCDNEKIPLEIFPVNRQCAHKFPIAHHSTLLYNPITHVHKLNDDIRAKTSAFAVVGSHWIFQRH